MLFTTLCFRGLFECTAFILAFTWVAKYPGGRTFALPLHIFMLTVQLYGLQEGLLRKQGVYVALVPFWCGFAHSLLQHVLASVFC